MAGQRKQSPIISMETRYGGKKTNGKPRKTGVNCVNADGEKFTLLNPSGKSASMPPKSSEACVIRMTAELSAMTKATRKNSPQSNAHTVRGISTAAKTARKPITRRKKKERRQKIKSFDFTPLDIRAA